MRASDRAYATLRNDIVQWRLPPGSVLAEVDQALRLGVSRTPLREALARLAADGLAAPHSGRSMVVTDISLDHVSELFELRGALECRAAELAAERGDRHVFATLAQEFSAAATALEGPAAAPGSAAVAAGPEGSGDPEDPGRSEYYALVDRLDSAIDAAAGNAYLAQALRNLRVHLVRVRRLSRDNPPRLIEAAREHATIAEAIAAGQRSLAAAATTVHLSKSLKHLLCTH
ncbi:GntR family transcriptional regulator [Paenarthrobacter sp. Z7-10]|uniref:GntR family transcriptional regulator n=1 Tax=Paenarthrobacter sp. Z7-10 TaxID=2787635 RepID=UPI0022A9CCA2|nr:GntR family transcriptional regulator [Paenarthrobacter sp. Z7-10]MCZ2403506.1 GntR family transcriptional regulator [Paenarthrobacter sp. Z7-10]